MFNLGGVLLTLKTQFVVEQNSFGYLIQSNFGLGDKVSIEIACGATKLAGIRHLVDQADLLFQPFRKNHDFLTQTGRRCGLAMGACQ